MVRYKMVGLDVNSASIDRGPTSPPTQYRTWVVNNQPDFTGQFYTGEKSGTSPFANVTAYAIFDDNQVVDFNLPNPLDWSNTFSVLPTTIYDSQLAVVGDNVYLFGGIDGYTIYSASLNSPTEWVDTGSTLPITLGGSQLAIIGSTVYLFGGQTSADLSSTTDVILSAPLSNPLDWTNNGHLLPSTLAHSQICIANNNIYLFGGNDGYNASGAIYVAPISDPLLWSNTGFVLPDPLYGSQLAIVDGYAYLLGGLLSQQNPTSNIYGSNLTDPTFWYNTGDTLPYPSFFGQFCTIGQQGYLFTQVSNNSISGTAILQCQLNFPTIWKNTATTIPGIISQSQLAIIYDRIWLFGGNSGSVIFSCNSIIKWPTSPSLDPNYAVGQAYGNITRTQYQAISNSLDGTNLLGFPYWKVDYSR